MLARDQTVGGFNRGLGDRPGLDRPLFVHELRSPPPIAILSRGRAADKQAKPLRPPISAVIFAPRLPAVLGFGPLSDVRWDGRGILDTMDYAVSNLVLPAGAILIALFTGWAWGAAEARGAASFSANSIGVLWLWLLRVVAPVLVVLVFLRAVGVL